LSLLACLLVSGALYAQETPAKKAATVKQQKIQAVSSNGAAPVPYAVIVNKNTGVQVMTDEAGNATIQRNAQMDTLLLRSVGFMDMVIYPGQAVPEQVRMVEDMISLDQAEVVIQGVASAESVALSSINMVSEQAPKPVVQLEVPQTAAELLWSTGSVLVQQSQQGGGSPILRGFEANRVLLVVDGVRMNNAIYRSGHLQNAITVDPNILERTDVLLGPNSILFGSDAMGGVIHYHTRTPRVGNRGLKVRASTAFRSPNQSTMFHGDIEYSGRNWATLTSVSHARYGDLRMGKWRRHGHATWGLDSVQVVREDGVDVVRTNEDPNVQWGSGYDQTDVLQKLRYQTQRGVWDLNLQWSASSDIPRYDVSFELSGDTPKWATWNYGPQRRSLASLRYGSSIARWDIAWNTLVSVQSIEESRIKRRFGSEWQETQLENVRVWNGYTTASKRFYNGLSVTAGINVGWDEVASTANRLNIETDALEVADTRYPNGGSSMRTLASFANAQMRWRQHRFAGGVRWSQSQLDAAFDPGVNYTLPFAAVNMQNSALTGGLSDRWVSPSRIWSLNTGFSTGFRHPNVDDMGKVREKGGYVLVPNDALKPEYLYSVEQSIHWDWQARQLLSVTLSGFGSRLNDAIVPQLTELNGDAMFFIDGDSARVQTHVNASHALIAGLRGEVNAQLTKTWGIEAAVNWTVGDQLIPNEATGEMERLPMSHIPPLFGRIASDIEGRWWTLEWYALFSGAKSASKFGPYATDNLDLMLETGAPSWWTLNAEFSAKLHEKVECRLGVRNLLDMHYRVFASGISAAGRGVYASAHAAF
jgi:hemoglobin/transferrin/lactoferrin receptor protein